MSLITFDRTIQEKLRAQVGDLEAHFDADVIFFYGEIRQSIEKYFRDYIEALKEDSPLTADDSQKVGRERLTIFLNTPGGSAETVEKLVEIVRHHYREVYFVVPDYAMSAGTILCLSGDRIYMDYSSSLGPIDPQVEKDDKLVPALGYLDKFNEWIQKSQNGALSNAELYLLKGLDVAELSYYEQARNLTITLLKKWLVEYKFKSWDFHESDPKRKGRRVSHQEKVKRAGEIAEKLGNNKHWHSHGRYIGLETLRKELKLRIEDYGENPELQALIREYSDLITAYIRHSNLPFFVHSRLN